MNITNQPLIFKQPLFTKNMLDIEFQTLPQSNIKPGWIGVSFTDRSYVRLFIKRATCCFLFSLGPQRPENKCLIILMMKAAMG